MHPTTVAVHRYHELLSRCDVSALWEEFQAGMQERLLYYGDRPVCRVLRPHFLHPLDFAAIAEACKLVLSAIHKVYQRLRAEPAWMARLQLGEGERELTAWPDDFGWPDASARMDAFWHSGPVPGEGQLYFLEYNADSPGGLAFGDMLTELFYDQEPMRIFSRDYRIVTAAVRQKTYSTLLSCYHAWCRRSGRIPAAAPHIAIVDWDTVATKNEFVLMRAVFEASGSAVIICDPAELEYRAGRLWAGGHFPVDIVYKRVVVNEFIARYHPDGRLLNHPLTQAAREGAACVVNGFNVQILYNKALFALLSDFESRGLFTGDEVAAIERHIPWTRLVEMRKSRYQDREIDLVDFIHRNKEELVLKPLREYGGRGVVLGWECNRSQWEEALKGALSRPSIVQKRVPIPQAEFPFYENSLQLGTRMVDVDPYVWEGTHVEHAGVRLGTQALLNVAAGGGSAVPLFLVQAR